MQVADHATNAPLRTAVAFRTPAGRCLESVCGLAVFAARLRFVLYSTYQVQFLSCFFHLIFFRQDTPLIK